MTGVITQYAQDQAIYGNTSNGLILGVQWGPLV